MTKAYLQLGCALGALVVASPVWAQSTNPSQPAATDQSATPAATPGQSASGTVPAADQSGAQGDQAGSSDAARRGNARVEERADVVVTGSRFEKVLQEPQSKSVIDAEQRNLSGIGDIRTIIGTQPGLNYTDTFGLNVRGVGRQTAQTLLGQENTVVSYVDGFINLVPGNVAESTLTGGNIQFLRGPSGTTYGRNALAGAVNLISRSPTKEFTGELEAGFGYKGYTDVGANIAGPITDNLGFRIGLQEFNIPSIQHNLSGPTLDSKDPGFAQKNTYIEFQLEWRPGPFHFRNRLTTFEYDNQPGYPTVNSYATGTAFNPNLPNNVFGPFPAQSPPNPAGLFSGLTVNPAFLYTPPGNGTVRPNDIDVNFAGYDKLRNNIQDILNADVDLGFASLVYVGGYQQFHSFGSSDLDLTSRTSFNPYAPVNGNPIPTGFNFNVGSIPTDERANYDNHDSFWSQELRLESKAGNKLGWVAGYYHFEQDFNEYYNNTLVNADASLSNPSGTLTGVAPTPNPNNILFEQRNIYHIRSNAAFGNITYDFTSKLRFDGGLRYTWDYKDALTNFREIFYYPLAFPTGGLADEDTPPVHGAHTTDPTKGLTGRAALAYEFDPGSQIYVSYARGYQSSAFTLGVGLPPGNVSQSEHLDVYEVGGNYTLGPFRLDASVFYQNFFNQQIPVYAQLATPGSIVLPGATTAVPFTTINTFQTFSNAPRSEIYGAEAELTVHPTSHSNIVASYTYLHPTFKDFSGQTDITETCPTANVSPTTGLCSTNPLYGTPQNLAGNEIPRTPRNKVGVYGYFGINLGSKGYLYPGGSFQYQSSFYASPFDVQRFFVPGRTITGFTLTYRTPGEHLDITGSVTNVFNTIYTDNGSVQLNGLTVSNFTTYGAPRYWTVTARYRF